MLDPCHGVGGEADPAGGMVFLDEVLQPRLIDRNVALVQPFDLVGVDVDAQDVMTDFRQHRRLHEADISNPKDGQLHSVLSLSKATYRPGRPVGR